ncbi:MAG: YjbQ family protein, partial [Rubrivivax sp.]
HASATHPAAHDDMPAHVRAALTAVQLAVPLIDSRLVLGTWQGVFLWEHRLRPQRRQIALHLLCGRTHDAAVQARP